MSIECGTSVTSGLQVVAQKRSLEKLIECVTTSRLKSIFKIVRFHKRGLFLSIKFVAMTILSDSSGSKVNKTYPAAVHSGS